MSAVSLSSWSEMSLLRPTVPDDQPIVSGGMLRGVPRLFIRGPTSLFLEPTLVVRKFRDLSRRLRWGISTCRSCPETS